MATDGQRNGYGRRRTYHCCNHRKNPPIPIRDRGNPGIQRLRMPVDDAAAAVTSPACVVGVERTARSAVAPGHVRRHGDTGAASLLPHSVRKGEVGGRTAGAFQFVPGRQRRGGDRRRLLSWGERQSASLAEHRVQAEPASILRLPGQWLRRTRSAGPGCAEFVIGFVTGRSRDAGDRHDRGVAMGRVRSKSTRIVKALARELLRALPDYAWSTSRGVDAVVTALVLSFPPFS